MNEEGRENLAFPPTGDSNDAGITVRAKEQANTAGAILYDQTWQVIQAENPHLTAQQVTDLWTLQIIADWNAHYQWVINDIANSNSVEEREQKIIFYGTKLDAFRASGIPVDNDLQYLRNVQGATRQEPDTQNQEWNTSPADVKRTDEAVKLSQEFREQVEYNYYKNLGPENLDVIGRDENDITNEQADEDNAKRNDAMSSALVETITEFFANFNKSVFGNTPLITAADREAGYWEGTMADGFTRVRVRYGEDGELALHPEDQKRYEETMGNYSKGIPASAAIQVAAPVLWSGAKGMLGKLGKVSTQGSSKATTVLADEVKVLAESPWTKGPITRGNIIDRALGNNLGRTFPTVDKLENGVLTSTKSLDVLAPTYQNEVAMFGRMKADINALKGFQSGMRNGVFVSEADFTRKVFELALPEAQLTAQQLNAINLAKQYAIDAGIGFRIVVVK